MQSKTQGFVCKAKPRVLYAKQNPGFCMQSKTQGFVCKTQGFVRNPGFRKITKPRVLWRHKTLGFPKITKPRVLQFCKTLGFVIFGKPRVLWVKNHGFCTKPRVLYKTAKPWVLWRHKTQKLQNPGFCDVTKPRVFQKLQNPGFCTKPWVLQFCKTLGFVIFGKPRVLWRHKTLGFVFVFVLFIYLFILHNRAKLRVLLDITKPKVLWRHKTLGFVSVNRNPGNCSVIQKNHKSLGFVSKPWVLLAKPWVSHKTLSFGSKTLGFMSKPRVLLAKPRVLWQNPGFCNWKPRVLFGKPWVLWIIGQNNFHNSYTFRFDTACYIIFVFYMVKGVLHLLPQKTLKLACFVLYLKIINIFLKNDIYIL